MAGDPFGVAPVGTGPYRLTDIDRDHAILDRVSADAAPTAQPPASADPLAPATPTPRPTDDTVALDRLTFRFFDDASALAGAFRAGQLDAASGLDPSAAMSLARDAGATAVRDPSTRLAAVALNLRATEVPFADPRTRGALLAAIDRDRILSVVYGGAAARADGLIPPTSWAYRPATSPVVGFDRSAAAKALKAAGWTKDTNGWHHEGITGAASLALLVPDAGSNPVLHAVGSQVAADWKALGFAVEVEEVDPAVIATDHLRTGDFGAVALDIAIGHDPDLYPLLASTQTRTGGANVIGLQDPLLDDLLEKARKPGSDAARIAAYEALQTRLAGGTYVLPIAWPDVVTVVGRRVVGVESRTVSDGSERFGGVLTWRLADGR
jgi:ABC-type transport system substrate-binding protein